VKILAFGTYDARVHPRIGVLLEGLRAHGDQVVEVNAPLGVDTASRVAMLRRPWKLPRLGLRLARLWLALGLRGRRVYRRERPDAVVVGYLGHFDVRLARLLFPRAAIVLDHLIFASDTAHDRGETGSWKLRLLDRLDRGALRAAGVIVVDTAEHAAMLPPDLAGRGVVVWVGAPGAWFAAGATSDDRSGPAVAAEHEGPLRVVFFGLFTPLQGTPVIGRALASLADEPRVRVTMVGTGQDLAETRRLAATNPHVTWREWVDPAELPALVARHDVCLGIFGTGAKARRVVPNKAFQGAAAGCAVVTSDTPPQRAVLGDAAALVPPGDADALAAVLRHLAADRADLDRLRKAARVRAEIAFTSVAVVEPLRQRLALTTAHLRTVR